MEQACAYGIEALEALGHLHSRNLLYCDFKVDNAIQTEDQLKLIDMGAVRRMDDDESAIYGTVGYQAPEVAEAGPSVASDLYTVARTLAVLTFDFQGYTNVFVDSLPDPDNIDVFRTYESFYRLLVRATDPDPARRFASAQEMAEQLTGVLREVVALQTGRPRPALSTLFGPEVKVPDTELFAEPTGDVSRSGLGCAARRRRARRRRRGHGRAAKARRRQRPGDGLRRPAGRPAARSSRGLDASSTALALPVPRVDPADPNAGFLAGPHGLRARRADHRAAGRARRLPGAAAARAARPPRHGRTRQPAAAGAGRSGGPASGRLAGGLVPGRRVARDRRPRDRGALLRRGLRRLPRRARAQAGARRLRGGPGPAGQRRRVLPPGVGDRPELCERGVRPGPRTARRRATGGGAVHTLESVPESSIHYTAARVAAVRARLRQRMVAGADPAPGAAFLDDLTAAAGQVEALAAFGLDAVRRERLSTEVLGTRAGLGTLR